MGLEKCACANAWLAAEFAQHRSRTPQGAESEQILGYFLFWKRTRAGGANGTNGANGADGGEA
tara:strand:- start:128 stop:316 length:189 start_codon:yes stop_codon:yes gene_type:complete